ncbi:hypothetical protein U2F10_28815 [Leptothoe sp. EHU-05/26/07-4]
MIANKPTSPTPTNPLFLPEPPQTTSSRSHTSNFDRNSHIVLAPQPNNQLHGTLIFGAENNPLTGFTTKEDIMMTSLTGHSLAGMSRLTIHY